MDASGSAAPPARLECLQQLTAALSRAATVEDVTEVVVTTVTAALQAQAALVALLRGDDAGTFEIVRAVGYLPTTLEQWRTFPLDAPLPAGDALRNREMVVLESLEDRDRRYPALRGAPAAHEAFAIVPLLADGTEPMGIIAFGFDHAHALVRSDRSFVQAVADQCAQAIHRARLYDEQRTAAEQRGFLSRAGQALAEGGSHEEVSRLVTELAVPELADGAAFYIQVPGGLRAAATSHVDPAKARTLEQLSRRRAFASSRLLDDATRATTVQIIRVDDSLLHEAAEDERHLETMQSLDAGWALLLPLRPRNAAIGVLALIRGQGQPFSDADVALAESYGSLAGLHCDNAALLEEQRRIAQRLQATLLPPMLPDLPGFEVAAAYAAAGTGAEVGGDFYDVFQAGDKRWFAVSGDVRGRGPDAATTTGLARHTVRAAAVPDAQPSAVIRRLNEVLLDQELSDQANLEPRFCAICAVALTPTSQGGEVTICCSGHPLPRLVDVEGRVREVGVPGTIAGVVPDPDLEDVTIPLVPGDTLVLFTDGITEQHTDTEFFEDRLPAVLSAAAQLRPTALAGRLLEQATAFTTAEPDDDMAVLVIRVPPDTAAVRQPGEHAGDDTAVGLSRG
jgi:serine phosphatase RsbU (regulator of sigma subunit)